jgi:lipopolysaccharide transport system ATP-binding protein
VKRGEVVGIIGRNGAGKSTLLKILSRITEPTKGRVTIRGRVASLLEVGTGFHPELTGRENIYLNGAILGMTRAEIRKKFDEIVAFGQVEKFLDTPVKRYSSGMYVRLAFAVAAHLEPEILLVDEVLSVGDAEFQRKCLTKMGEVARGGRTVLFVSHNMAAIKRLTARGIVLDKGQTQFQGPTDEAINRYSDLTRDAESSAAGTCRHRGVHTVIREVRLLDKRGEPTRQYESGGKLWLQIVLQTDGSPGLSLNAFLLEQLGAKIACYSDYHYYGRTLPARAGLFECTIELEPLWLATGSYSLDVATAVPGISWDHYLETALRFDVAFCNPGGLAWDVKQRHGHGHLALGASTSTYRELTASQ